MGFRKEWDMNAMSHWIQVMGYNVSDYRNDGFTQFEIKKDLYRLKWILEDALRRSPSYLFEDDWLREQEQKKIIDILSKK